LVLVFAIQKMRHYLVGQTIHAISKVNPLRFLMTKPSSLNVRLAKWVILLSQYEMQFLPQNAIKGQAVADFLAEYLDPRTTKLYENLLDEITEVCMAQTAFEEQVWQLFFDDASRMGPQGNIIVRVRVVLIFPQNHIIPHTFSLTASCSNNVTEYNALLIGI